MKKNLFANDYIDLLVERSKWTLYIEDILIEFSAILCSSVIEQEADIYDTLDIKITQPLLQVKLCHCYSSLTKIIQISMKRN